MACGRRRNANQPPNDIRKSVFLHADVMQIIVAILCQIVVADIGRNQNV